MRKPALLSNKSGYVKIRLTYLTSDSKHIRNTMLQIQGIPSPHLDDICILLPQAKVFLLIECYMRAFASLQECGIIAKTADLWGFQILEEDEITLAYIC